MTPQDTTLLLERAVEEVINKENIEKKLQNGQRLRIKLGIDPTSPNIHLGRTVPLLKLKTFKMQDIKLFLL